VYRKFFKRFLDIVISLLAIIILGIPMLIIALIVKVSDPGPALFKQKRVGIHKTYFNLYKFRSMKMDTPDVPTHLLENPDSYLIGIGKALRKSSLDELPQLINILKGDMSIVGPRPALWNQDDLIAERDKYNANDCLPGLTGWAQVNGRDELAIPVKAKFDGEYANNISFAFDLKCFFRTFRKVATADGIVEGKKKQ